MPGTVFETLLAGVVYFGVTLPPGLLTLRALKIELTPLARLAIAMALGLVLVLSALLAELILGGPWLILPLALIGVWLLRADRSLGPGLRAVAPELLLSMLLGSLPLLANRGDVIHDQNGFSARVGFDVSDRAFYGTVAQELERAPIWHLENPAFAPSPLQYSYLPAMVGVFVHRYAGVDPLVAFGTCLPAFGVVFTGIAAAAFAQSLGVAEWPGRVVTMILVALGGDLSFLVPEVNGTWLERTRLFFVFHSFGAESLFYNPWMFGVPVAFVTLLCIKLLMERSGYRMVGPSALLLAALFQTKVFAFIPIWVAVLIFAVVNTDLRVAAVAALSLALASPGLVLVAMSEGVRGGAPLAIEPLAMIREAIAINPSLSRLATAVGFPVAVLAIVLGGFGLSLPGLIELLRRAREFETARFFTVVVFIATICSLTFVGRPTRAEGVQFMFLAHALLWVFAGVILARMLQGSRTSRLLVVSIASLSVLTPIRYLAMKTAPETFAPTAPGDRLRFVLSAPTLQACQWLRVHSEPRDRLALPIFGDPEDRGGLKPLYVGLLASRRIVGNAVLFHVSPDLARERQTLIQRLFETTDGAEGEAILDQLRAAWVFEDPDRRLRFPSPRLIPRAEFGRTRIVQVKGVL